MGDTPLVLSRKFASRISFEYTILDPSGPGVSCIPPNTNIVMRGELATPPLWGGVGWPILHNMDKLGQEYTFLWDTWLVMGIRSSPGRYPSGRRQLRHMYKTTKW